jgi:hypothetical protein
MRKHVKKCWGEDVMHAADKVKNAEEARQGVVKGFVENGSISTAFKRQGKRSVTYSHRQHTRTETK